MRAGATILVVPVRAVQVLGCLGWWAALFWRFRSGERFGGFVVISLLQLLINIINASNSNNNNNNDNNNDNNNNNLNDNMMVTVTAAAPMNMNIVLPGVGRKIRKVRKRSNKAWQTPWDAYKSQYNDKFLIRAQALWFKNVKTNKRPELQDLNQSQA